MKERDRERDEKPSGMELSRKEEKRLQKSETYTLWNRIGTGLFDRFRKMMKSGPLGRYLTSYDKFESAVHHSFAATLPRETFRERMKKKYRPKREIGTEWMDGSLSIYNPATLRQPLSSRFKRAVSSNRLLCSLFRHLTDIPRAPVSALGTFVFSMGVACVLAQIVSFLLGTEINGIVGELICGFLLLLLSVPIISRNNVSIGHYVLYSRFGYRVLAPMLGMNDERDYADRDDVKQPGWFNILSAMIGLICGGLTYLFPLLSVVLTVILTVLCLLTAFTPELGLNLTLIFLPFSGIVPGGTLFLGVFTGYTAVCFLFNVLIGKRVMRWEAFDFAVLTFALFVIASELFMPGDYARTLPILLVLTCVILYFLAKNLLRDEKWIENCMGGLISASFLVSLIGIIQAVRERSFGVSSVFETPEQLAIYLLLTLFLTLGSLRFRHLRSLALILTLAAQLSCLILTGSKLAVASFLLTFFFYLGISGRRMFSAILLTLLCLPMTLPLLPRSAVDGIGKFLLWEDSGMIFRKEVWANALELCRQGFFGGIGISGQNFAYRYSLVASGSPVPEATSAWGLYLDLVICIGILGLALFLALMLLLFRHSFTFYHRYARESASVHHHQSVFCSIVAILLCGFFISPFENAINLLLFWTMIGFALGIRNAVIRECTAYQRELSPTDGEICIGYR